MQHEARTYQARIVPGIGSLPEAGWTACYPDDAEGWRYYRACESGAAPAVRTSAVEISDGDGFMAAAPLFELSYRLDTSFQSSGIFKRLSDAIARNFPRLAEWRLLGVGSPYADQCHIAVRPGLSDAQRADVLTALIAAIEEEARRRSAPLIAYKDLQAAEYGFAEGPLAAARYAKITSLPVAVLDIEASDAGGYLATLSAATRKDVRRKLKSASGVRIEHRSDIGDIADQITALYESTRTQSGVDYDAFEELPEGYFRLVSESLKDRVSFVLYWVGDELAAFNMLLLEPGRVIDKFIGMRYPLARDHNLYAVSWMENIRFCLETGRRRFQSGQTAYGAKLRLGSHLVPSAIFVKHLNPALNWAVRQAAPLMAFDRWDPELRAAAKAGRIGRPALTAHARLPDNSQSKGGTRGADRAFAEIRS